MERLTEWVKDCPEPEEIHGVWIKDHDYIAAARRLAEYEDTGLTPDEVEHLIIFEMAKAVAEITEFDGVPIQRLKELAAADKSGNVDIVRHESWEEYYTSRFFGLDKSGNPIYRDGTVYYCTNPMCRRKTVVRENYCPNCGAKMGGGSDNGKMDSI